MTNTFYNQETPYVRVLENGIWTGKWYWLKYFFLYKKVHCFCPQNRYVKCSKLFEYVTVLCVVSEPWPKQHILYVPGFHFVTKFTLKMVNIWRRISLFYLQNRCQLLPNMRQNILLTFNVIILFVCYLSQSPLHLALLLRNQTLTVNFIVMLLTSRDICILWNTMWCLPILFVVIHSHCRWINCYVFIRLLVCQSWQ